tara:strand:+ start:430 stop:660 length:231 start_codon:yes stop_codon:yes gene_type:complete
VLATSSLVVLLVMLSRTGASLTALTVKVKALKAVSPSSSITLALMVAVPLQFSLGVNVSVAPEMVTVTFVVDEVAE